MNFIFRLAFEIYSEKNIHFKRRVINNFRMSKERFSRALNQFRHSFRPPNQFQHSFRPPKEIQSKRNGSQHPFMESSDPVANPRPQGGAPTPLQTWPFFFATNVSSNKSLLSLFSSHELTQVTVN